MVAANLHAQVPLPRVCAVNKECSFGRLALVHLETIGTCHRDPYKIYLLFLNSGVPRCPLIQYLRFQLPIDTGMPVKKIQGTILNGVRPA